MHANFPTNVQVTAADKSSSVLAVLPADREHSVPETSKIRTADRDKEDITISAQRESKLTLEDSAGQTTQGSSTAQIRVGVVVCKYEADSLKIAP